MNGSITTSIDVVRFAIADRVRALGASDEAVGEIALAACYAMWCTASATEPSR